MGECCIRVPCRAENIARASLHGKLRTAQDRLPLLHVCALMPHTARNLPCSCTQL